MNQFSISFHGSARSARYLPRYRKQHDDLAAARAEIARVAEPGVVHGPDGTLYAGRAA